MEWLKGREVYFEDKKSKTEYGHIWESGEESRIREKEGEEEYVTDGGIPGKGDVQQPEYMPKAWMTKILSVGRVAIH
jgi:hypothetical protein